MTMRDQLQQRLETLKIELETGEKMLADLDAKRTNLRETLLRISGAIQVLEEELAKAEQPVQNGVMVSAESKPGHHDTVAH
jgi:predicted  nucleic acid-binding Zn-ribbon protein